MELVGPTAGVVSYMGIAVFLENCMSLVYIVLCTLWKKKEPLTFVYCEKEKKRQRQATSCWPPVCPIGGLVSGSCSVPSVPGRIGRVTALPALPMCPTWLKPVQVPTDDYSLLIDAGA